MRGSGADMRGEAAAKLYNVHPRNKAREPLSADDWKCGPSRPVWQLERMGWRKKEWDLRKKNHLCNYVVQAGKRDPKWWPRDLMAETRVQESLTFLDRHPQAAWKAYFRGLSWIPSSQQFRWKSEKGAMERIDDECSYGRFRWKQGLTFID